MWHCWVSLRIEVVRTATRSNRLFAPLLIVATLARSVTGGAQPPGGATPPTTQSQAMQLYVECLQDLGLRGNYTWTDGGASAIRLAEACQVYGKTVIEECMAMYFHPDEKTCRAANVLYAQTVLRALHK
jgi:hypothetical protein